jgi:MFS family permease
MAAHSIVAGMALGPAFGTLAGGMLMGRIGWRLVFLVVGLTSLLWLPPWLRWMPKRDSDLPSQSGLSAPSMLQILEQRSAWGNVCRSLLYQLLDVLPLDLAALLPGARTSFFVGRDGEDRGVCLFSDGRRSHLGGMGLRSPYCLMRKSNPGSQNTYGRGASGGWDIACCLRRQRACALGSMPAALGGVLGNQRFQYLGHYSNARGTASSWQVDRAAKLLR